MRVKLLQAGAHSSWKHGEIITLQVVNEEDGVYECETLETFPSDLKEKHAVEVARLNDQLAAARQAPPAEVVAEEAMPIAAKPPQTGLPRQPLDG